MFRTLAALRGRAGRAVENFLLLIVHGGRGERQRRFGFSLRSCRSLRE